MPLGYVTAAELAHGLVANQHNDSNIMRTKWTCTIHDLKLNDDAIWIQDYKDKLEQQKFHDPKTIFGWALKGIKE